MNIINFFTNKYFKIMKKRLLLLLITAFTVCWQMNAQGPVDCYGQLQVNGNKIYGSNTGSTPVQVKGVSFGWNNFPESSPFFIPGMVDAMVNQWKAEVIRVPMAATSDQWNSGYDRNAAGLTSLNNYVIQRAIDKGVYVIIDWHSHFAENEKTNAKKYMVEMAQKWGKYDNVIFEIYNEPLGSDAGEWNGQRSNTTWNDIKTYANEMITAIREHSDNLIIVGTRNFSQCLNEATGSNAIGNENTKNIAYAFHFYAASHRMNTGTPENGWNMSMQQQLQSAMNNGKAVFVTEWGTVGASGGGSHDAGSSSSWMQLLDQNKISSCAWQVSEKDEAASFFQTPGVSNGNRGTKHNNPESWFGVKSNFSASGQFVYQMLQDWSTSAAWRKPGACGACVSVNVTFDFNYTGGPADEVSKTCTGSTAVEPSAKPQRTGYRFLGWFTAATGGTKFDFKSKINAATTIYAQWEEGEPPTVLADGESDLTNLCTVWYQANDGKGGIDATVPQDEDGNILPSAGGKTGNSVNVSYKTVVTGGTSDPEYKNWGCMIGFSLSPETTEEIKVPVDISGALSLTFDYKASLPVIVQVEVAGKGQYELQILASPNWKSQEIDFSKMIRTDWSTDPATEYPWEAENLASVTDIAFAFKSASTAQSGTFGVDNIILQGKDLGPSLCGEAGLVDKTALIAELGTAKAKYDAAVEGTEGGQYQVGSKGIFLNAINEADAVNENEEATQEDVDAALSALQAAVATFNSALNPDVNIDKTALTDALANAKSRHEAAIEGTAKGNYKAGAKDALKSVIDNAEAIHNNPVTQTEVNNAVKALQDALEEFEDKLITEEQPAGPHTLIADCEKANETKLITYWYSYATGLSSIIPVPGDKDPDSEFTMTAPGFDGAGYAAHASGTLVNTGAELGDPGSEKYESAGIGFAFTDPETDYDLTGASGVSFYHKGDAVNFSIINSLTDQDEGEDYNFAVPASANWQLVVVAFPTGPMVSVSGDVFGIAGQAAWANPLVDWDPAYVTKLQWQVKDDPARNFEFAIDHVSILDKVLDLPEPGYGVNVSTVESASFAIYPNPAKDGNFNVSLEGSDNAILSILNLQGQVVYSAEVSNGAAVNANLGAGVYVVSVQTANSVQTQKLIVK